MSEITLELTHALLERLAEYVMTEVAPRRETNERFEQIDKRFDQVDKRFDQVDKRFEQIDKSIKLIHHQLDLIRSEQKVFADTFVLHHKRLVLLEDELPGYRVREGGGKEK